MEINFLQFNESSSIPKIDIKGANTFGFPVTCQQANFSNVDISLANETVTRKDPKENLELNHKTSNKTYHSDQFCFENEQVLYNFTIFQKKFYSTNHN